MAHGTLAHGSPRRDTPAFDLRLVRRLWTFVSPHRRWVAASLALLIVTSACALATPFLVKTAIDSNLSTGDLDGFWLLVAAFVAVILVEVFARGLQTLTVELAGQNALLDLRVAVFRHLQRLSASFYDRTPIGRLVGRVTTDVEALQELFSSGVVTILGDLLFLVTTVVILLTISWKLTLVTLVVVPLLLALTLFIRVRVRAGYAEMITRRSALNAYIHEHVSGMPLIQAFAQEDRAREGFDENALAMRDAQLITVRYESLLSALTEMLAHWTMALILWFGAGLLIEMPQGSEAALSVGVMYLFLEYMNRFFGPLNDLSLKFTVMQNAMTASDRIFALLDEDEVTPEPESPAGVPPARGAIELDGVTFAYNAGDAVLRDISFRVEPGERVAIVGATGAGKTTILKLLTRLYDVQQGALRLDGVDVRDYALADLRRRVGIVPQDVFLFGGDVLSNVRLGHPEIGDEEAIAAADALHLDEVVARFPRGYREPVRERGKNLSAGERQLVAFARVLAVAPPVLVLDEATSNVDTHTEHLLQEAVHKLIEGRTSLVIAHRLSTIRDVDRILVLHKGALAEEGTHDELLARRGVYWNLYRLQYQEQEESGAGSA